MLRKASSSRPPRQPSYRLHKARGCAVVTINGKNHYLGTYDSPESHQKYASLISQWRANGRVTPSSVVNQANGNLSISELILGYMNHAEGYYKNYGTKHQGEISNLSHAMKPLQNLYGHTPAAEFTPELLENIQQALIEHRSRKTDQPLARTTINERITRIKRVFRWGARKGLVPPSVYHGLRAVEGLKRGRSAAKENPPVKPAPEEDIKASGIHMSTHIWAMVQVQELAGMRPQDIRNMRTGDIDMSQDVWVYKPFTHKNEHLGQVRQIAIGPKAQTILKPFLKPDKPEAFIFSPREAVEAVRAERKKNRKTPMTPSQRKRTRKQKPKRVPGEQYTKDTYARAIARACVTAKVTHWHPHQLRHQSPQTLRPRRSNRRLGSQNRHRHRSLR